MPAIDKVLNGDTDSVTLLSALTELQRDFAQVVYSVNGSTKEKQWAIFYALREIKDKKRIETGQTQGLKLSKSKTAREWAETH